MKTTLDNLKQQLLSLYGEIAALDLDAIERLQFGHQRGTIEKQLDLMVKIYYKHTNPKQSHCCRRSVNEYGYCDDC